VTEPAIDQAAFDRLVEMTGGEMDFVDELVDTYLEDGAAQVDALEAAVAAGGASHDLVRPAHSLKSSSLNVGALRLGGVCRELEEAARSGVVPDAAERVRAIAVGFAAARAGLLDERVRRAQG
jgi:HPt (histidine-containing phosphotransfer) domain-containing protein